MGGMSKKVNVFSILRKGGRVRKYNQVDGSFKDGKIKKDN
jgi:hypothetical protein